MVNGSFRSLWYSCIDFRHPQLTDLLLRNNQVVINGIRAAEACQLVLSPGNDFTRGLKLHRMGQHPRVIS